MSKSIKLILVRREELKFLAVQVIMLFLSIEINFQEGIVNNYEYDILPLHSLGCV